MFSRVIRLTRYLRTGSVTFKTRKGLEVEVIRTVTGAKVVRHQEGVDVVSGTTRPLRLLWVN